MLRGRDLNLMRKFAYASLLVIFFVSGAIVFRIYRQPLGPSLNLPGPTQPPATRNTIQPGTSAGSSRIQATPTPQPICGAAPVMNILAIGSDARAENYLYGLADIIRLVRVDFVNARVTILEVPRDLWVEIPDISDHYNITQGKLNQAYLYGNKGLGYYDGPGAGPGLLARTLDLNFGVQPDHYLAVNMTTFENIVDAVGGIDIYLPYDVDVRSEANPTGFHVEEGQHHFDGETALWVARIRQYSTFSRAENQNIVMCALRKKLLSPALVPAIPELVNTFQRNVQTDLSPEQINQLACLANQLSGSDVVFASIPIETFTNTRIYDPQLKTEIQILDADFAILRDYIDRFQQGTWPDPDLVINSTASPAETDREFACED
jgi:LCP family protein required for cell wall assembly